MISQPPKSDITAGRYVNFLEVQNGPQKQARIAESVQNRVHLGMGQKCSFLHFLGISCFSVKTTVPFFSGGFGLDFHFYGVFPLKSDWPGKAENGSSGGSHF